METFLGKTLHYASSEAEFLHNLNAIYIQLKQLDTPFYLNFPHAQIHSNLLSL